MAEKRVALHSDIRRLRESSVRLRYGEMQDGQEVQYYHLPVPPSANHYWRTANRWRRLKSGITKRVPTFIRTEQANAYRSTVAAWASKKAYRPFPSGCRVSVVVAWYRSARRGDLDNRLKVALDALQGVAYENDRQIVDIAATVSEDTDDRLVIVVERLS